MDSYVISFIQDLTLIMFLAAITTIICNQLKQPVVLGYILCGIIIGPHITPIYISHEEAIKTLAELGVIFLMFSLGLEFNIHKLKKVGLTAFIGAFFEICIMILLGYGIGIVLGWSTINAIFLGAILAISSTTIIVKALEELDLKHKKFARIIFGILIVEDIFAIAILALLSGYASSGVFSLQNLLITTTKLLTFLVVSLTVGILFIPKLIGYVSKFKNNEVLLITVLGLCFSFSLLVVKLNYSIALGAFLIGAIIAESNQVKLIEQLIMPLRNMFSAIFFVTVGILFDPASLVEYFAPIVIITLTVVIGKILSCSLGVFLSGNSGKTSIRVGMGMAQIGEFSFIIASLGMRLKVTSGKLFSIAVAVSAITTFLTPYLIKYSDQITRFLAHLIPTKVSHATDGYTHWLQDIREHRAETDVRTAFLKSLQHILLNIMIVIGAFLGFAFLVETSWVKNLSGIISLNLQKTIAWYLALLVASPFIIAIHNKIKKLINLLLYTWAKQVSKELPPRTHKIASEVLAIISLSVILILIFRLTDNLLPPLELLFIALAFVLFFMIIMYSWLIKLHEKLHKKLLKSLKKDTDKTT